MKREAKDNRPRLRPVEKIELSDKHIKLRWIAAIIFLVIGAAALALAFHQFVTPQSGWMEVNISGSLEGSCAGDFTLMYHMGAGGASARAENQALTALYSQATETAYRLFHSHKTFTGLGNLAMLNQHPNEELEVESALYQALALVEQYGSRDVYLGPVYEVYDGLFQCGTEAEAAEFDPYENGELRGYCAEIAAYAADPQSIRLELLGENRVRLAVSADYLRFAEENEITALIDFGWMQNAFIADYLAQVLTENGYTRGILTSYDGYVRNLDSSGASYSFELYDRVGESVRLAAVMQYTGPKSFVYLRDYPINYLDAYRFYVRQDGQIRSRYLDVRDGLCKSAAHDLAAYSGQSGCGELLLQIAPYYVADTFAADALPALTEKGVSAVYCRDNVIYHTDREISLTDFFNRDGVAYTAVLAK